MMKKSTETATYWLIECGVIKKEEEELYRYAIHNFILSFAPLLMATIFGICLGCVKQSIVMVIPYMEIRRYSGGYHTKHLWTCMLCSSLLLLLCILFSLTAIYNRQLLIGTTLASISLGICSPLEHENRILSRREVVCYKKATVTLTILFFVSSLLFRFMRMEMYAVCISVGVMLSAGLQMPNVLMKLCKRCCKWNKGEK